MSSLKLEDVMVLSQQYPNLSFNTIQRFISLALRLKDDILLAQPLSIVVSDHPDVLPPTIVTFLQASCSISEDSINSCWEALKSTVWLHVNSEEDNAILDDFAKHGHSSHHPINLVFHTLYPPQQTCVNPSCSYSQTGKLLKKEEQHQGVLYTLDKGAVPVRSVHLYCAACNTNYHHNFHIKNGIWTYYDSIPDIIPIGEHQFAEKQLIQLWITLMLVSWTSATNCARIYNLSFPDPVSPDGWAFGFTVTTEQVWDGCVTLALLNDCQQSWRFPILEHKRIVSPMPCMLGIFASMSMANPNYATIVKSVYG
ncbi:hypothetical protein L208DRAFT_1503394, partial [Tricholoma matsutake]